MKIKFMQDFEGYKKGDLVEVSEAEAEDHHEAGRAYPYHGEPAPKPEKVEKPKSRKARNS
jgi:hypothetical protein